MTSDPASREPQHPPAGPTTSPLPSPAAGPTTTSQQTQLVEVLLTASRALVGLAARSLADLDHEVTLPQYRALVVLASRGPQRVVDISTELGIDASTGTRMCERLVRKHLIRRTRSTTDRRAVRLSLTPTGRALVDQVTQHRRTELARIVAAMPSERHPAVIEALTAFITASGEIPEEQWWLGWTVADAAT